MAVLLILILLTATYLLAQWWCLQLDPRLRQLLLVLVLAFLLCIVIMKTQNLMGSYWSHNTRLTINMTLWHRIYTIMNIMHSTHGKVVDTVTNIKQWNLSKTATCRPVIVAFIERWLHYRGSYRLQCFSATLVLFGVCIGRLHGCSREVVTLYTMTVIDRCTTVHGVTTSITLYHTTSYYIIVHLSCIYIFTPPFIIEEVVTAGSPVELKVVGPGIVTFVGLEVTKMYNLY